MVKNGEPLRPRSRLSTVDDDKTPWLLLDLAWTLPGDSPTRAILSALADAWEELPLGWRKLITAGVGRLA